MSDLDHVIFTIFMKKYSRFKDTFDPSRDLLSDGGCIAPKPSALRTSLQLTFRYRLSNPPCQIAISREEVLSSIRRNAARVKK